jgi:choline dehydrogenase
VSRQAPTPRCTSNDVVVVGAGSAGCALAARLAASGARVELVEAGPAPPTAGQDATNCDLSGRLDWSYVSEITGGRRTPVPRGRALGGSSVINTCVALRPDPASFAAWEARIAGWGWSDVLPYLRRLERDVDFPDADYHGGEGPVPVVRWREDELEPASRAFRDAAQALGLPDAPDLNAPGATGVGPAPMNREGWWRASAERTYLCARPGPGPRILVSRLVDRVLFRGTRAIGVRSYGAAGELTHAADRVVLCAGAYGTPAILLRSGVGPAEELRDFHVDVVANLAGVGRGLCDHSQVHLAAAGPAADVACPALQTIVRTTTPHSPVRNDVQLCVLNRVDLSRYAPEIAGDERVLVMLCAVLQHAQSRGRVSLAAREPDTAPCIEIDYAAEEDDRRRYREALRLLARVAAQDAMASFPLLGGPSPTELDDRRLDALVAARVKTAHHPMGTARMGPVSDPSAVVAADLAVHGVEGLSVADASVVPVSLNANIHLACTMIGERAADLVA